MIEINLNDHFQARPYQMPILDAFKRGYKRIVAVLPRRAGKDLACWNLMIEQALKKVAIYWYILPTYSQGRKVIWDGKTSDGRAFLDFIPKQTIASLNQQEMKVRLINDSIIQVVGSDNVDRLVGANPYGIIFSEAALSDERVFPLLLPILKGNDGWCIFISTPRSKNWFYDLFMSAQRHPETWFSYLMNVDDTKHISREAIQQDIDEGLISSDLAKQEYDCSFDMGIGGIVYGSSLDKMRAKAQIGRVPYEPDKKVHTAWDLGRDTTAIIFFQVSGKTLNLIDYYENKNEHLEHYVTYLKKQEYVYGVHFWPHDGMVKEWAGQKFSRRFKASQLGLECTIVKKVDLEDGIEFARSTMSKVWIDEVKCKKLIKALENYRYEWDDRRQIYTLKPVHDWASHAASAFMYLCLGSTEIAEGMTAQDVQKLRQEAIYGDHSNFADPFQQPQDIHNHHPHFF